MVICYSNYINETFKTISNFQEEASELNESITTFNFIDAYVNVLREIQGIIDFINFLQSFPFDFNKSISKTLTILEKIISSNKAKDPDEINRIIRLLKKLVEKENTLLDDYDKTQKKLIKIRTKLFTLFEKSKKKKICKAFNFISLACYHFFSFTKPTSPTSASIFKFLVYLLSYSINLRNITADKPGKNIDLYKWSQITIENSHSYTKLIKYYNEPETEDPTEPQFDQKDIEDDKNKLKILLRELDEMIEAGKSHGFDKLRSKLQASKEELIEKLQIEASEASQSDHSKTDEKETEDKNDINDGEVDIEIEKPLDLLNNSLADKSGYTSVYSSFYSDDLDTKFTKSLPTKRPRSQFGLSPLLRANNKEQPSSFNSELLSSNPDMAGSAEALENDSRDLSLSDFNSYDLGGYHGRRNQRRKLTSSHSIFRLSAKNSSLSSSSFSFRVSSRKPILIDSESPIKIKPSGRHLTFLLPNDEDDFEIIQKGKRRPSISPYPENVDPELLIPFIPNPPFAGWVVSYLLKKITFSTLPTVNYRPTAPKYQFSFFNFHLPPIKQLIEETAEGPDFITAYEEADKDETKKSKTKKKKKSLIHFRKKKKEEKNKEKEHQHEPSSPKKKSWFKKSEMDKKSAAVIKQINISLRNCWKNLRNAKNKNDQFGRFQTVSEWYKTVCSYIPTLVNYSKDFPNNEFIVDAVREYERIRVEFDEILNEIEFIKGQTMVENVQQSAKQLSLILVALDIYINNESIQNKPKLSIASKIMGYLTNILCNLQIIVDCPDPSSYIACSDLIINLYRALNEFSPVFNDLESFVKKSILTFAVKSILLTLKPAVVILYEIDNNKNFSKSEENVANDKSLISTEKLAFSNEQINEQIAHLKKVSDEFLNSNYVVIHKQLYVAMISDLFEELINLPSFSNPLFITDLNELGNVVESTFIEMQNQIEVTSKASSITLKKLKENDDDDTDNDVKSIKEVVDEYKKEFLSSSELKNCLTVLASIRKLQFMLTVKLGNEFHDIIDNETDDDESVHSSEDTSTSSSKQSAHNVSIDSDTSNADNDRCLITNSEFVRLVTQNESDFSELADLIQMNSVLYNSGSLQILTKNWFDSIFQITFAFVDLLKVAPILNKQPYLYDQVDSFYELLFEAIQFFKNTVKAKINVSSILDHLMANIKHTQQYSKIKPFCITSEKVESEKEDKEKDESKDKKKKKKDNQNQNQNQNSDENSNAIQSKFANSPLFEQQIDLEKYKCGFFVNRIPIYKRAIFADFIQSVITKLREPRQDPRKAMDFMANFFIQVFTSIVNISQQLRKDEEKEKEKESENKEKKKENLETKEKKKEKENEQEKEKEKIKDNKEYFLMLLINRERDNILHMRYSEDNSFLHLGVENKNKLIFLFSIGELLAKYFELASMLSDDDQKIIELRKKSGRKRRRRRSNIDSETRKRRGRIGEEFSIESLTDSDKFTDSDVENNNNGKNGDDENNENENENDYSNADSSKTESDNYSNTEDEASNDKKTKPSSISKDAKNKLKEMRQFCKASISHLKKISKKLSRSIIQPFNAILRAKPATVKSLFICSDALASSLIACLMRVKDDLDAEKQAGLKIKSNDSSGLLGDDDDAGENGEIQANSIIINKNESSCSLGENEGDKKWLEIKECFDSIVESLQEIKAASKEDDDDEGKDKEDDEDDEESRSCTAGVFFEQIYADITNIPLILECSYEKAARLLSKIEQKIAKYAHKSLTIPYSERLTKNLIDEFSSFLKITRNSYLKQYKMEQQETAEAAAASSKKKEENDDDDDDDDDNDDENEKKKTVNLIINEKVNSQFEELQKTSKILLQRELIEKSNDVDLLLMILSQKLIEQASNLHPSSEDYSFVLKTIMNMSIAVLNGYRESDQTKNASLSTELLKMFVASFDYFIELFVKEMENDVLSDDMIRVIHEFEKLPMQIPGYYAPKLCLRFLLIEADNEDDDDEE